MGLNETRRDDLTHSVDLPIRYPGIFEFNPVAHSHDDPVAYSDRRTVEHTRIRTQIKDPTTHDQQIAHRPRMA